MTFASRLAAVTCAALMCWTASAFAQQPPPYPAQQPPPAYPQQQPGYPAQPGPPPPAYAPPLFDYIRRAMPWNEPRSLNDHEVYALTAYILAENKLIDAKQAMNALTLPKAGQPRWPAKNSNAWAHRSPPA